MIVEEEIEESAVSFSLDINLKIEKNTLIDKVEYCTILSRIKNTLKVLVLFYMVQHL